MYKKAKEEVRFYGKVVALGIGAYALLSVAGWANFQHGSDLMQAKEAVVQSKAAVNRVVKAVESMSGELIKLNDKDVTAIVIKYMQPQAK